MLLKAYISEWTKYFTQCSFLPMPFQAMETATGNTKVNKKNPEGNRVYLVRPAMLVLSHYVCRPCTSLCTDDAACLEHPHLHRHTASSAVGCHQPLGGREKRRSV